MMVQRNSQVLADNREPCRPQLPLVACHADRAAKLVSWRRDVCMYAARVQDLGVERRVMRDQEIRPVQ